MATVSFTPRGYTVQTGFFGFLPDGRKLLFPTQDEYLEYLSDLSHSDQI